MIKRVICIDDDAICLMIEEMVIRQSNIAKEIHLINHAPDALSLLDRLHLFDNDKTAHELPTLLFLDLNMPVMDGFAFLEALDKRNGSSLEKLKVVILSSSIDTKDISRSKAYKTVIDFISKPLTAYAVEQLKTSFKLHTPLLTELQ